MSDDTIHDETTRTHPQHSGTPTGAGQGTDAGELFNKLTSNEHIPPEILDEFWSLFGLTTKLTFIDGAALKRQKLMIKQLILSKIQDMPDGTFSGDIERLLTQIEMEHEKQLLRSKGLRMNERELQSANTYATYGERNLGPDQTQQVPLLKRILTLDFGGKK